MVFNTASHFDLRFYDNIVIIIDLDKGGMSVTNDIENVIRNISKVVNLRGKPIIYRDSDKTYSRIHLRSDGEFSEFAAIKDCIDIFDLYDAIKEIEPTGYTIRN